MKYTITVDDISASTDDLRGAVSILMALAKAKDKTVANGIDRVQLHNKPVKKMGRPVGAKNKVARKYVKHFDCPECGKNCKGLLGLGVHRYHKHGIVGPSHEAQQAYRANKLAQLAEQDNNQLSF